MRLKVKSTSWAVKGSPSCQVTSLRRWKVQVRPSSDRSQDSASAGSTSSVSHEVSVRPSKRYPKTPDDEASAEIARLNVSGSETVANVRAPPWLPMAYSNCSAFCLSCSRVVGWDATIGLGTGVGVGRGVEVGVGNVPLEHASAVSASAAKSRARAQRSADLYATDAFLKENSASYQCGIEQEQGRLSDQTAAAMRALAPKPLWQCRRPA